MNSFNKPFTQAFRAIIDKYREENPGTTNEQLAEMLDISTGQVSNYYNGKVFNPNMDVLQKIHNLFDVSFAYLFGETPYSGSNSIALMESEIFQILSNAKALGMTAVVDNIFDNLIQISDISGITVQNANTSLVSNLIAGGNKILGQTMTEKSFRAAGLMLHALMQTRAKAEEMTVQMVNACQLIDEIESNKATKSELIGITGHIALTRDIYSDLDKAVAEIKRSMDVALAAEIERLVSISKKVGHSEPADSVD